MVLWHTTGLRSTIFKESINLDGPWTSPSRKSEHDNTNLDIQKVGKQEGRLLSTSWPHASENAKLLQEAVASLVDCSHYTALCIEETNSRLYFYKIFMSEEIKMASPQQQQKHRHLPEPFALAYISAALFKIWYVTSYCSKNLLFSITDWKEKKMQRK